MVMVKFGKKTDVETPHKVCPPPEEVFARDVDENAEWFLPLLTVDLGAIDPAWSGKAPTRSPTRTCISSSAPSTASSPRSTSRPDSWVTGGSR
ncbi:MAG: hypothetical protein JXR96_12675 [Deltaproteobacteria bacterium]|nr:hypothetical protein [Deltaproteobacteria bacterium]